MKRIKKGCLILAGCLCICMSCNPNVHDVKAESAENTGDNASSTDTDNQLLTFDSPYTVIDDENVYTVKMALPTLMNVESSGKQEGEVETTQKTTGKSTLKSTPKSTPKSTLKGTRKNIVEMIESNPTITLNEIAEQLGKNPRGIDKHIKQLQDQGIIRRIGPAKGGHWEIVTSED